MCDCNPCVCSWISDKDKRTIEDRIEDIYGRNNDGTFSPEALAKMQEMKAGYSFSTQNGPTPNYRLSL